MADLISPADMVRPKAIAPFEAQHAFAAWAERWADESAAIFLAGHEKPWEEQARAAVLGFGPPFPLERERPTDFGLRAAAALFHFIKES